MNIAVVIATFGDREVWDPFAERAERSVRAQTRPADEIIRHHGTSLGQARNAGAERASSDLLVFLDADDELDAGYLAAMERSSGDIRQPSTLGVVDGREDPEPVLIPSKPLLDGNYLVIGSGIDRGLFSDCGGFDEDLAAYEDWEVFIKMWLAGAVITACPEAVYRVHVRAGSRNQMDRNTAVRIYNQIRDRHIPTARAQGLA